MATARAAALPMPCGVGGIGVVLTDIGNTALVGIDLDTCRMDDDSIAPWAQQVIERFASYTEVSPSETGFKIFFRMTADDRAAIVTEIRQLDGSSGDTEGRKWAAVGGEHPPAIELFLGKRFFTVTERWLETTPGELRVVDVETVRWLIREAGPAAFAGENRGGKRQRDKSRSGEAAGLARAVYSAGMNFDQFVAALHANPKTAEWARTKGAAAGGREIKKTWTLILSSTDATVTLDDFWAYMPHHNYIFVPTRSHWPAASVDARLPKVPLLQEDGSPVLDAKGKPVKMAAAAWLDKNKPVEQMTWAPGMPLVIEDRLLFDGGWFEKSGVASFNLYVPPLDLPGDPAQAGLWIKLVKYVYPNDSEHIFNWSAHRVQKPHEKLNHGLVLGGEPGIGKDTIVEAFADAIGRWNFQETAPEEMMKGNQNPYVKAVVLRINEARDLGDSDRFKFHDHTKALIAAPPPVLRVNEKYIRQYLIPNVCGVVITTNNKDGLYLPPEDRRHYVAWSDRKKEDEFYKNDYWKKFWKWLNEEGGSGHVAAYLRQRDISGFDAKAPPLQTAAFWEIVNINRSPEESELADALDNMGNPAAVILDHIRIKLGFGSEFGSWLGERKNRRTIPHRLEKCDYVPVRNPDAKDGLWKILGSRQVVYARTELSPRDRDAAARKLQEEPKTGEVETMQEDLLERRR